MEAIGASFAQARVEVQIGLRLRLTNKIYAPMQRSIKKILFEDPFLGDFQPFGQITFHMINNFVVYLHFT